MDTTLILVYNVAVISIFFGIKSYLDYKTKKNELKERVEEMEQNYNSDYEELDKWSAEVAEREKAIVETCGNINQAMLQQQQNLSEMAIQKQNMDFLIKQNEGVVKRNNVYLLSIQAHEASLIDRYKEIARILSGMIYEGKDSFLEIQKYLLTINTGIVNMEQSFEQRFKMTPNEFKNTKKNGNTDFSLN
jgi:hypothetical protein